MRNSPRAACLRAGLALIGATVFAVAQAQAPRFDITLPNPDGRDPSFDQRKAGATVEIEFHALDGGELLSLDDSAGDLRLINYWATWCVPCIRELPALAALAAQRADAPMQIVPISLDQKGADEVPVFIEELNVSGLTWYADPSARSGQDADVFALPTTVFVDGEGRELGRVVGAADWLSPAATELIDALLDNLEP